MSTPPGSQAFPDRPFIPASDPSLRDPPRSERAAWGYRAGATLVDIAISVAPGLLIDDAQIGGPDSALPGVVMIGTWILNVVVLASLNGGQTIGKLVAGTRIVREDGRPYGFGIALLRDVVCRVMFVIPFVFLIDSLWPLGRERQSLRDRMVGTLVLKQAGDHSRRLPLAIAALAAAAALGGVSYAVGIFAGEFDDGDRAEFVDDCREEGLSRARCDCAWTAITSQLSYGEYIRLDRQDPEDWSSRDRSLIEGAFAGCPE